jgi:hypothetical protein
LSEESAIREDVQQQQGTAEPESKAQAVEVKEDDYNPRKAAMEAVAARHRAARDAEITQGGGPGITNQDQIDAQSRAADPEPAAKPADPPAAAPATNTSSQVAAQSGELLLTPEDLKRVRITTKVDGVEHVVDGTKVLASYQKNEAADVRLARAGELERAAATALAEAEKKLRDASTKAEAEAAQKKLEEAQRTQDGLGELIEQAQALMYEGKTAESAELWKKALTSVATIAQQSRGPEPAKLDETSVVSRVVPAVRQQLEVESALTTLYTNYPQIKQDEDFAHVADRVRARLEADGVPRPEAIVRAGDEVAKKFGLTKSQADASVNGKASTTRDNRLAAKSGLDEPNATAARATVLETPPPNASSTIAKMAALRGQQI